MCFSRTFAVLEEIQQNFASALPFERYHSACHILAHAGAHVLNCIGYTATVQMCAIYGKHDELFRPHVIVESNDMTIDFKKACYQMVYPQTNFQEPSIIHDNGMWKPHRVDIRPLFKKPRILFNKHYFQNYECLSQPLSQLLHENRFNYKKNYINCITSCEYMWK